MSETTGTGREANAIQCEQCGAPLPAPDAWGFRTCHECGHVNPPRAAPPQQDDVVAGGTPTTPTTSPTTSPTVQVDPDVATGATKGVPWVRVILALVVLVGLGAVIFGMVVAGNEDAPGDAAFDVVGGATAALPEEPDGPLEFVSMTSRSDGSSSVVYELVRSDGSGDDPVWTSPPIGDQAATSPVLVDATNAYTVAADRVYAFRLADGTQAWQGALAGDFSSSCDDCFLATGGRIVVRSGDGTLQAFDAATGAPAWSRRLQDVNAPAFVAGDRLLLIDGVDGDYLLYVLNPADGGAFGTIDPVCPTDGGIGRGLDTRASVLWSPFDRDSVYLLFGSVPACAQRWDLTSNSLAWSSTLPDDHFDGDQFAILSEGRVITSTRKPSLLSFEMPSGAARSYALPPDTTYRPLAANGGRLVVVSEKSSGTVESGLAALSVADGTQEWAFPLGESTWSADPSALRTPVTSGETVFAVTLDLDQVRIVRFDGATKDLVVESVALVAGTSPGATTFEAVTDSPAPYFSPAAWRGDTLLVVVGDQAMVVDTSAPEIVSAFP